MQRTLSTALASKVWQRATVQGWVRRRRRLAKVSFLIIRDRGGLAQVVLGDEDGRTQLDDLGEETVVCVDGMVTANAKAPGGVELTEPCITTLSSSAATPPVELWRPSLNTTLPTLLDHAPLLGRHRTQQAIWRLAAASVRGFRRVLDGQGFTEIHTPKLVASSMDMANLAHNTGHGLHIAALADRDRIARDLHDHVIQDIRTAIFDLQTARGGWRPKGVMFTC